MFIDTTMTPKVDELLRGMIVQIGQRRHGRAGRRRRRHGRRRSSRMMNRQAQAWGLKNTAFKNVTGLTEPGHAQHARATSP